MCSSVYSIGVCYTKLVPSKATDILDVGAEVI